MKDILELSDDEHLFEIGKVIAKNRLFAFDEEDDKEQLIGWGKRWYKDNSAKIKQAICNSFFIKAYLKSERIKNRLIIICALGDVLSPIFKDKPVLSIASLVITEGLETICNGK
jgi:hypothetical protein